MNVGYGLSSGFSSVLTAGFPEFEFVKEFEVVITSSAGMMATANISVQVRTALIAAPGSLKMRSSREHLVNSCFVKAVSPVNVYTLQKMQYQP